VELPASLSGAFESLTNSVISVTNLQSAVSGVVRRITIGNPGDATAYVQVFDAVLTSDVTLGSTSAKAVFGIAPGEALEVEPNVRYTKGLAIAATTTPTGSTAPGTNINVLILLGV
jgi:hypothetical protein